MSGRPWTEREDAIVQNWAKADDGLRLTRQLIELRYDVAAGKEAVC